MNAVESDVPFIELARRRMDEAWEHIEASQRPQPLSSIPENVRNAIKCFVNCKTKTYRYVLPTQLLAKCVDPELDCRAIQKSCDLEQPFDARSLCHEVIVPFDRDNHNVLGGSAEPYVSKPVRHPSVTPEYRASQKNKSGWDDLMCVLDYAQANPHHVEHLSNLVLLEIRERLKATRIDYPAPNRPSQKATLEVISRFLEKRSGGLRMQALSMALFELIGNEFGIYREVLSSNVNAADAATGKVADLECVDSNGEIVLAVEVKDRQLTLVQV